MVKQINQIMTPPKKNKKINESEQHQYSLMHLLQDCPAISKSQSRLYMLIGPVDNRDVY